MKKEIKNFGNVIEVELVFLTFINLIICALEYTNIIYAETYDTMRLNNILIGTPFTIFLWLDNILIYITSIFYIIDTIQKKNNMLIKLSFCFVSICTSIVMSTFIINGVAKLFGII